MFGERGSYRHAATRSSPPSLIGSKTFSSTPNTVVTTSIRTDSFHQPVLSLRQSSRAGIFSAIGWGACQHQSLFPSRSPSSSQILSICIYPSGYLPDSYLAAVRRYLIWTANQTRVPGRTDAQEIPTRLLSLDGETISSSPQWALRPANLHCLPPPNHRPCKRQEGV